MSYLATLQETQHGQRARLTFFLTCLENYRRENELARAEISALDLGCGSGRSVTFPIGEAGYKITGIDIHRPSIEWARSRNNMDNVHFLLADIEKDLPLGQQHHAVILADVLEHLSDPRVLLVDVRRLLVPDGIVLISIPNGFGPFEIETFLIRSGPLKPVYRIAQGIGKALRHGGEDSPFNFESGHVQHFTKKGFITLLNDCGFRVTNFRNGAISGGDLSGMIVRRFPPLMRFGVAAAPFLPDFLSSVWHWEARPKPDSA